MAHRMQITLEDEQYQLLRTEAERTGASIAELVRRALNDRYRRSLSLDEKLKILEETAGAWGEERAGEWERGQAEARASRRARNSW